MQVFVLNQYGKPLMPCGPRKARLLLKANRARVIKKIPFTIQLCQHSTSYTQPTSLGIDTGSKFIGVAVTQDDKVLSKGQIELRQDVKSLLETCKQYRRSRRAKLGYREPRFLNRKKPEGWLPPSIQSRVDHTIRWIKKFRDLLPNCKLNIEVGKFDIQKLENPGITGKQYQQGTLYEYRNRIAYLLAREKGMCQSCHKPHDKALGGWRLHHIWGKSKDRPADWALLHKSCHIKLHQNCEEALFHRERSKSYKESTFMNIIRRRLFREFPEADFTYGNITFQDRCDLGLEKTHANDAVAITGIKSVKRDVSHIFVINQFRKKKRSLHEATARKGRTEPNRTAKRNAKNTKAVVFISKDDPRADEQPPLRCKNTTYNTTREVDRIGKAYHLNDRVRVFGGIGFISGFCNGGCYVKDILGNYIMLPNKNYKQVSFANVKVLEHNNNWQFIPQHKEASYAAK